MISCFRCTDKTFPNLSQIVHVVYAVYCCYAWYRWCKKCQNYGYNVRYYILGRKASSHEHEMRSTSPELYLIPQYGGIHTIRRRKKFCNLHFSCTSWMFTLVSAHWELDPEYPVDVLWIDGCIFTREDSFLKLCFWSSVYPPETLKYPYEKLFKVHVLGSWINNYLIRSYLLRNEKTSLIFL